MKSIIIILMVLSMLNIEFKLDKINKTKRYDIHGIFSLVAIMLFVIFFC